MNNWSKRFSFGRFMGMGLSIVIAILSLQGVIWVSANQRGVPSSQVIKKGVFATDDLTPVITIGVGSSLSLPFLEPLGYRQQNAAQLAVDQINDAGGIEIQGTSYQITLVSEDDQCDALGGANAATSLLAKGSVAVVGYTCSSASNAAQPIHRVAQVPMVSPSSTWVDLTEQGYTTTFRVISRDDSGAIYLATYLRNWSIAEDAAIIEMSGYEGYTAPISQTFSGLGGSIVDYQPVTSTDEFTATLNAINSHNPQVIFYTDPDVLNIAELRKTANRLGMNNIKIAWVTLSDSKTALDDFYNEIGAEAEGTIAAMQYRLPEDMPGYDSFNAAYQAKSFPNYGDEGGAFGAFAYDATMIILDAIQRAQSTQPQNIRQALAQMADYEGVVGTYQGFDDKGDVIPQWAWLASFSSQGWAKLHPTKLFLPLILKESP